MGVSAGPRLDRRQGDDAFSLPDEFTDQREEIAKLLHKLAGRLDVKDADERRTVRPRQAVLHSPAFKALWDRIKHKTTYRVAFDNEKLLADCTAALRDAPAIARPRLRWRKADIAIGQSGVDATETAGAAPVVLDEADLELPDVLTELQDRTQLTRRSIARILCESGRLDDFRRNPQEFIERSAEAVNRCKRLALVDGIRYQRLGDEQYYGQELFESEELTGYLKNMLAAKKSVHEQIVYDSDTEAAFADPARKERRGQGVRQATGLVPGADAARQLHPGLGGTDRVGRRRASVLRRRNQGEPCGRRPARHRSCQDRVRQGALRRPPRRRVPHPLRSDDQPRYPPCGCWCGALCTRSGRTVMTARVSELGCGIRNDPRPLPRNQSKAFGHRLEA